MLGWKILLYEDFGFEIFEVSKTVLRGFNFLCYHLLSFILPQHGNFSDKKKIFFFLLPFLIFSLLFIARDKSQES